MIGTFIFLAYVAWCINEYIKYQPPNPYDWEENAGIGYSDADRKFGFYEGMWMNQDE
tara:strand:+ start:425 stop:595 length:171 start_codon:yes stop_codon:yes gene_type:complete